MDLEEKLFKIFEVLLLLFISYSCVLIFIFAIGSIIEICIVFPPVITIILMVLGGLSLIDLAILCIVDHFNEHY
jgi:xanthine/uracil permease